MLDLQEYKKIQLKSDKIQQYLDKGELKPHPLNELLDPYPTEEEIYALGNSLISTDFTNKLQPIVVWRRQIVDGKSRFKALQNINAKVYWFIKIPDDVNEDEIKEFIKMTTIRRDKTKTQKAIAAYRYYLENSANPSTKATLDSSAKMFGVSIKMVQMVKTIDHYIKISNDTTEEEKKLLDTLFNGGFYQYTLVNKTSGEVVKKSTTSISTIYNIFKGKHKEEKIDKSGSMYDELTPEKTIDEILFVIAQFDRDHQLRLMNRLPEVIKQDGDENIDNDDEVEL